MTLAFAPERSRIEARLAIRCAAAGDAASIAAQLTHLTSTLRDAMARENRQPDPAGISGVLAGGAFRAEGVRVLGTWPIERAFVQSLMSGQ